MDGIRNHLMENALFLVWGPPSHARRSMVLARALGIANLHCVHATTRRGLWIAPIKYGYQTLATFWLLLRSAPELIFVQSPPSFAVWCVYLYCWMTGARYLVDAHSDALQSWYWTRPAWVRNLWARGAIATLVTNEHFQQTVEAWGGRAFILRDIPTEFEKDERYPVQGDFTVAVVNTFSRDEPIGQVVEAAAQLPDVQFYVTGKTERALPRLLETAPENVHFTGYLPDRSYYALLNTSHAVMCLTTRNHTMQRGACEALSLGKPIITSDWPLLRTYFHKGTVHVANTGSSIGAGVRSLMGAYDAYQIGIRDLQKQQQREWQQKIEALMSLIQNKM